MLLSDVLCYAFLTVTITTSCTQADSISQDYELSDEPLRKHIVKRDSPLVIDHFPYRPILKHRPKFIYKRVSNPKYRSPKPAYGVTRTKQRSAKPSRKVMRKYRKSVNPKYSPPSHYKRPPKIRYANPRTQEFKPLYGLLKRSPDFPLTPKPAGFGEPPSDYYFEKKNKMNYGDPSDVYRGQIKVVPDGPKFARQKFSDSIDVDEHDYLEQKAKKKDPIFFNDFDGNFASSEKRPVNQIRGPEYDINKNAKRNYGTDFHTSQVKAVPKVPNPPRQKLSDPIDLDEPDYLDHKSKIIDTIYLNDFDENFGMPEKSHPKVRSPDYQVPLSIDDDENIFSDVYNSEKTLKMDVFNKRKKQKRAERFRGRSKPVKASLIRDEADDDVIVGGRYAEPPGRYYANYNSRGMMVDDDNFAPPGAVDPDVASSATMSPYVNYKHSNLAFSPQNLNDAFSIVD
ncbi:PREDICTED: uncharacterized protein LOC106110309 [Papilio polytes]|uniref:uncharacterized protein LOC106110309 n=1 Tax=Papilio polytes TaxID=76194 RepID=UPI0006763536|nr:PREDICTED: uncharacterized protein LOC106110309 [Papilio polytes]